MAHRHGFQFPMGVHQIVALVMYLYLLLIYYTLTAPFLPSTAAHIALQVVYGVAAAATLAFGVTATWLDPSDPSLKDAAAAAIPTGYKCSICQVYVRPRSKHCRVCDRCTEDFDHHCMWLNNCVGRINYPYFFALLCSTLLLCSAQFGISLYLFIQSFVHRSLIQPLQQQRYKGHVSLNGLRAIWPLSAVLAAILGGLIADLLTFHLVLRWKGMSTYDYILAQREAQEQSAATPQLHLQQYKCACLHKTKTARVTPDVPVDDLDPQLASQPPKKKLKVKLNPIMAWRVKSNTSNPRPAHARARMSSMAQYIMPSLFTSKSAEAKAQLSQRLPTIPAESGEQVSAMHNPMFDIEAHADSTAESAEPSSTRLPVLLTPSVGPSIAWSPLEPTSPKGPIEPQSHAGVTVAASAPDIAMNMSESPLQPHLSIDNALFAEPLLHG